MKNNLSFRTFVLITSLALLFPSEISRASDQTDVRDTVQRVFDQLKSHDYNGLYDVLPSSSRTRMSRDRFVSALQRAQDFYQLDRLEIGATRVSGNLAVVDTVLYGRVVTPIQAEGKIVVQQYLVREEGKWRVATGDQSTVRKFLAANPAFSKGFKIRQPRIFVKQNDKWQEFNPPRANKRQARLSSKADLQRTAEHHPRVQCTRRVECDSAALPGPRAPHRGENGLCGESVERTVYDVSLPDVVQSIH